MKVHLCGVRGSTPAPGIDFVRYGGHTPCVALEHDAGTGPQLILDAGVGLANAARLLNGSPFKGTILLSHLHWDHVLGLPFFAAGDREDADVQVLLPEQPSEAGAESVLSAIMRPPYFPIEPGELRGSWRFGLLAEGERTIEGFTVLAREVPHKGGRTFGYRISDGHSTLAYIPDHCPTVLGAGDDGFGEYHPAALELAGEADLLIHDAQLLPEELGDASFGHSVADYAVELARRAGTRAVALFHHRPDRSDDALDQLGRRFAGVQPRVEVATEGTVVEL